ncbi:MAG: hypothetical protein KAI47_03205 [Deltaproteobacteria bacterium]|nr:hypothetical protein [Deltaproteobacteria bacterium]
MRSVRWLWLFGVLLGLGHLACAKPRASVIKPEDTLRAYARALEKGRYDEAYALMSGTFRKRHTKQEFARWLQADPKERLRLVARLRGRAAKTEIHAVLKLAEGEKLALRVEKGAWHLIAAPLDFYSQKTPRSALRSFIRAVAHRRYAIVLRFVPAKWASVMTVEKIRAMWEGKKRAEVELLLKELKENIEAPIVVTGSSAKMPYGIDKRVRFVREEGRWKVEDPD